MADSDSTIHLVSSDESLLNSARAALGPIADIEVVVHSDADDLMQAGTGPGDIIFLDGWGGSGSENIYETCRRLTGKTRCRTFLVGGNEIQVAEPIAVFCGATGVLTRPLTTKTCRNALTAVIAPRAPLPGDNRGKREPVLPELLVKDLVGESGQSLIHAITDPETSLFSFEYLTLKLDEEYKRAVRFRYPLSCVMLGFDGQADNEVLRKLSGVFLQFSRDTDILGRFDESSFLFLLPHTGPDGAEIMARRIGEQAEEMGLRDLVGDPLNVVVGISSCPHPEVTRREELFSRSRDAFQAAQHEGRGAVRVS